ncbi:MAG: NTP transferase domain-containing protein, partial [Actinobacteria bacterium]|nr:NTP transferase domain-containing protein [Actinomycetota bacterium]
MGSGLDIAIVLAAGEGTRMKSSTSKVLHTIAGRSIVGHVLAALAPLSPKDLRVVVGAQRESVEAHIKEIASHATTVFQAERNGTGHAVQLALDGVKVGGNVLILAGDTPLLTSFTLQEFLDAHIASKNDVSVLTAQLPDPTGYGRIIRDEFGGIIRIVEERDASEDEREIDEINTG